MANRDEQGDRERYPRNVLAKCGSPFGAGDWEDEREGDNGAQDRNAANDRVLASIEAARIEFRYLSLFVVQRSGPVSGSSLGAPRGHPAPGGMHTTPVSQQTGIQAIAGAAEPRGKRLELSGPDALRPGSDRAERARVGHT